MNTLPLTSIPKRKQPLIVWEKETNSSEFGQSTFKDPVEIACRWDGTVEQNVMALMKEIRVSATIYPDHELKEGDYVMQGSLADLPANFDPVSEKSAIEIQKFLKIPNFGATKFLLIAYAG
jgi:hypothetical protein